jgi:hypothetical protein
LVKRVLALTAASFLLVWGTVRCGDVPQPAYGDPSGLHSTNLPGEAGAGALVCDGGGPGDGGPINNDAGCPSWSKDIYPSMQANGPWQCTSSSCHGGPDTPPMSGTDPTATYNTLKGYKNTVGNPNGLTYIDPAQQDPTKSTIVCNLARSCGQAMPNPPGVPLTCAQLTTVTTWVRCGSPNN